MFDFIKKLFKKPVKTSVKNNNRTASVPKQHPAQPTRKPECCCKKEEKAPECTATVASCSCDAKPSEPVVAPVEPNPVVEAPVEAPVEAADETKEEPESAEPEKTSSYIIKLSGEGIYNFELVSPEGKTIIKSGDYTLKRSCVSGIQSVKKNGATENMEDRTLEKSTKSPNPKYEVTVDENSKYHFSLKAPNGYVILTSPAYNSKRACTTAIKNVRSYSQTESVEDTTK